MVIVLAVGLAALAVAPAVLLAVSAVRRSEERGIWAAFAAAAWTSLLAGVPVTIDQGPVGLGACMAVLALVYVLFFHAHVELLSRRFATHRPGAWLDRLLGIGLVTTLGYAVVLPALLQVQPSAAVAALMLLPPALSLTLLSALVLGLVFSGDPDPRQRTLVAAMTPMAVADLLGVASTYTAQQGGGLIAAANLLRLLGWFLVVRAARQPVPPPPRERTDEDGLAVLVQPAVCLVVCGAVFAVDHVSGLGTPAVVAAVVTLLLVGVKVALVFARVTTLNTTRRLAMTDELTGLGNRRALAAALGAAGSTDVGLVAIDLDGFKSVNDTLGHDAGDELLRLVADRVRRGCRPHDTVARQGGDEFAVVVTGPEAVSAIGGIAARLRADLSGTYRLDGRDVLIGASIGVASCPQDATDLEGLMQRADRAMYRAKASGGGVVFASALDAGDDGDPRDVGVPAPVA